MTTDPKDDFDRLTSALRGQSPQPDPAAKRAAMMQAMKNFDELAKETGDEMRPTQDRPQEQAGFLRGVRDMFYNLTSKQALAATTSVAAICIGMFVILPLQDAGYQAPLGEAQAPVQEVASSPEQVVTQPAEAQEQAEVQEQAGVQEQAQPQRRTEAQQPVTEQAPATIEVPQVETQAAPVATARQSARVSGAPNMADATALGQSAPARSRAETAAPANRSMQEIAPNAAFDSAASADMAFEPPMGNAILLPEQNTETFATADTNPVKVTKEEPVSTFSADVDTASYAVVRDSLMSGYLPPAEAVRVEEMINYFPYSYPAPDGQDGAPFNASVEVMQTPWNADTQLVRIGLQGQMPAVEDRPPLNLVFLIDTSGSMQDPDKLPLLKQSLRMMLGQLRPEDQVAIVTYAGSAGQVLEPTAAGESAKILSALDRLDAGGSTNGAEGLELAYRAADSMAGDGEVSRILLATDGDFNVGISDPDGLEGYIARKREAGTYLSVLGFGRGNLDDATMQALAQNGNGQAAYIDTLQEAQKVLVDQLSGALFPIAGDVKLQVEWNPAEVAEYRLIGYETRALRREDFNNDKVDAGELGAGHAVTAIYEVTPPDSPALLNDALRYQSDEVVGDAAGELGFLRMRYKSPGESESQLIETPILPQQGEPGEDARFAAAIAGFGQLLTGASYLGDWGWDDAIALAQSGRGDDPFGYRNEAISLMRLAESLEASDAASTLPQAGSPDFIE